MESEVTKLAKLSHKQFRAMLKKYRRKRKRQRLAKEREQQELLEQQRRESSPNFKEREEDRRRNSDLYDQFEERESIRKHKCWLLREQQAQLEFKKTQEQIEVETIKREEERKRILAEFEQQQYVESKAEEENRKIKSQKEENLQGVLSKLPQGDEPWHNPIAPQHYIVGQEREECKFFAKTGCCRYGDSCSRGHPRPSVSTTLLIRGMYSHFSIGQTGRDDFDTDNVLEYEDSERYQDFKDFYFDVLPEFKKFGKVLQFKVCSNHEPHLRGNVYVQFLKQESAVEAYQKFNGRYYAGRQLTCEFTHVSKWRSAICGLYFLKCCHKGINCNFLHVFRNPTNEFQEADRDFPVRKNTPHSSRSDRSRSRSERSSRRGYSRDRHHRDVTPDHRSDYYYSSSNYHDRSTDSDSVDQENGYHSSSRRRHSDRSRESFRRSHHKKKHRCSKSRSPSPSLSESESLNSHKSKHKKKKKSKKSKRERTPDGS